MENAEYFIARWQSAGLLDEQTAGSLRAYEATQAVPAGRQWQVLLALILGGILLGAGVLLFVAAHWDSVSPLSRTLLVLTMLPFFHGCAWFVRDRFSGLATALHGLGTVSCGAAIALVGQIFNMQEHWPAAVMLWALCAGLGWFLLRDQIQQTLTLLLLPAWIVSEWYERTGPYDGQHIYLARILAVLAIVYLTAFHHTKKPAVFGILFGVGAVMLPVAVGLLEGGWASYSFNTHWGFIPLSYRVGALSLMLIIAVCGAWLKFDSLAPAAVVGAVAFALPWGQRSITYQVGNQAYTNYVPSLLFYLLLGGTSIFLVGWGVRSKDKPMVNYGTAAFAVSVLLFYFSSVMDKLNRSLGLILLGVLFLAGGWALEVTRRRLVSHMNAEATR